MKSKGLLRFQNRLNWFDDDIEFADIITKIYLFTLTVSQMTNS